MIQTVDQANALLERCSYRHPWAEKVTWRADQVESGRIMCTVRYHQHPDTTEPTHHQSFDAGSWMLGVENATLALPCTEEELVDLAYRLLLAVEQHEVGERFKVDGAPVFHPHANPNGTWCKTLDGTTWKHPAHALEPRRKSAPFSLLERLKVWKEGFK